MKKSVKILSFLNILTYINNFMFSFCYVYAKEALKNNWGLLGVWVLSPYLFITITSFIMATDNKEGYKIFKIEAIVDWVVRFVACGIAFQDFKFKFLSYEYIIQQCIILSLLMINIMLEFRMYKKATTYIEPEKDNSTIEKISEDEKQNIKNMGKATTIGVISFFLFCGGLSLPLSINVSNTLVSKLIPFMFSIVILIWFIKLNYNKCMLFYLDKEFARRIFIRDSIYAVIGYIVCFLSALNTFGTNSIIYSVSPIVAILFMYPTIRTNRKMGLRYRKIVKILGDNFELYFNCNDK